MRIARRTVVAVFALAVLGSCSGGDGGSAATVTIHTFSFQPDPITVQAGTKITFHNDDKILHTVTSGTRDAPTPDRFDSKLDGAGSSFTVTLDTPGTYPYFCKIHPGEGMTGKIVVR